MKPLFITVDTEGDALWDNPTDIKTENVLWIPKFQELCEKYGFIPMWLTDYEIISDDRYVEYIKEKNDKGLCEVGIHVHARNNPPLVKISGEKEVGAAYLIEYPYEIMRDKFLFQKDLLESKLGKEVITHRAGRWTMNQDYVRILVECGIKYDCSVTPGIDWSSGEGITPGSRGSDWSMSKRERYMLYNHENQKIIEYPMTIVDCKSIIIPAAKTTRNYLKAVYHFAKKSKLWVRPNVDNLNEMKYALRTVHRLNEEYAEFMIHSSELMPGGGPQHVGEVEIRKMFDTMEQFFIYAKELGYGGFTFDKWEQARSQR